MSFVNSHHPQLIAIGDKLVAKSRAERCIYSYTGRFYIISAASPTTGSPTDVKRGRGRPRKRRLQLTPQQNQVGGYF